MQSRARSGLMAILLSLFLVACSGGGGEARTIGQDCGSGDKNLFCLTSCTLGCTQAGCSINRISQNEPISLVFSQEIDKFSVPPHTSSILLRTSTGEEPVGNWVVEGNRLTFRPDVSRSGAAVFYGFLPNRTYYLTLEGGDSAKDVVRSMGGDRLGQAINCSLDIGGIRDLNEVPPSATLITPSVSKGAKVDTQIILRFNEILDPAVFESLTTETSPVKYSILPTNLVNGELECRLSAQAVVLPGTPTMEIDSTRGESLVYFTPGEPLLGGRCVQIAVTSGIKDLAGVPAEGQTFSFITEDLGTQFFEGEEDFENSLYLDREESAGEWGNGSLNFSPIGGSGVHGAFDHTVGTLISTINGVETWELDTDDTTIPANKTATGQAITIKDGRFFFTTLEVPRNIIVRFVGSNPVRIWVRGSAKVEGVLSANGADIAASLSQSSSSPVPGSRGGPFGGKGGDGAERGDGVSNKPQFNGKDGATVQLPAGHAYGTTALAASGGKGSRQWPADGRNQSIVLKVVNFISAQLGAGGSGGAFVTDGTKPSITVEPNSLGDPFKNFHETVFIDAGKGAPLPAYTGPLSPQDFYMIGGSGGGGGGSSAGGALQSDGPQFYKPGYGGSGGGGALALRIGGNLEIGAKGRIEADGGDCAQAVQRTFTDAHATGGSGSGGSVFIQVNGRLQNLGAVSALGGLAGLFSSPASDPVFGGVTARGGKGSDGIIHFEVGGTLSSYDTGTTTPANPGLINIRSTDTDDFVSVRSLWYPSSLLFPPDFVRYEIHATVDGNDVVYSDDPAKGQLADGAANSTPLRFRIQGTKVEEVSKGVYQPAPNSKISDFRRQVGPFIANEPALFDDGATGYRFELGLDRNFATTVVVKKIIVVWKL